MAEPRRFDPSKFVVKKARPIPVILLLDVSGSMEGGKIEELNDAVEEMIASFKAQRQVEVEIDVAIITFGDHFGLQLPLGPVAQVNIDARLTAGGNTPMGAALSMAKEMIEDRSIIPSNGLRPMVLLVSDGQPTDDWEDPMDEFIGEGRSSKCNRMAMAIQTPDDRVLQMFTAGTENGVFHANQAGEIHEFFTQATMTVTTQTQMAQKQIPGPNVPVGQGNNPNPPSSKKHYEW